MTRGRFHPPRPELVRAIGRWGMVALAVNSIVGSGIFGLPSVVAGFVGGSSPIAVLLAGAAVAIVVACYAEVASQFRETGGHYLYVQRAFGRLAGLQVGWLNLLTRLTACAAAVNLFILSLGEFWPRADAPVPRLIVATVLVGALAAANYRGVTAGLRVSNVTAVAKLVPLLVICITGLGYLAVGPPSEPLPATGGIDGWLKATLTLFFLYGGYEAAVYPLGEARHPRRDVAFALFAALIVVTLVYTVLQLVVVRTLPDPARSLRPLADAAGAIMGRGGAVLVSSAAIVSVFGYLSANFLTTPRATFALAERGDFPRQFAAVHPRHRTPHVSVTAFALAIWAFALFGSFASNVTLSAVARLVCYAATCAAVPALRRKQPEADAFRLPGAAVLPALGVLICLALLTRVDLSGSLVLAGTIAVATANWLAVRNR